VHDAAAGDQADDSSSIHVPAKTIKNPDSSYEIGRGFFLFDTSGLPDTDNIESATLSLYVLAKQNVEDDGNDYIRVVTTTPASNTAITTADYDQVGTTSQTNDIDLGNITTSSYNTFTLNSTGLSNIIVDGITKFGTREGHDVVNSAPTVISGGNGNQISVSTAEESGTSQDPKLIVVHAQPAPVISNVQTSNVTSSSATVTWDTNINSDSKVTYGTTTPVTSSNPLYEQTDETLTTNHSVNLSSLSSGATYYYVAVSTNPDGNAATSTQGSFTTSSAEVLRVRKTVDESTANDTTLSSDIELSLTLNANTSYLIDGVIFASSTSATPDIKIGFDAVNGSVIDTGYLAGSGGTFRQGEWLSGEATSSAISISATEPTVIQIHGSVRTGSSLGNFVLQWAQNTSNANGTTVMKGSYLRAQEI